MMMDPIILPLIAQIEKTAVGGWLVTNHAWLFEGLGASVTLAVLGFMIALARECLRACGRLCLFCVRAVKRPRPSKPSVDATVAENQPTFLFGAETGTESEPTEVARPAFIRATTDDVKKFTKVSPDFDPFATSRSAALRNMNLPPRPSSDGEMARHQAPAASFRRMAKPPFAPIVVPSRPRVVRNLFSIPALFFLAAGLNAVWVFITWLI